MPNLIKSFSATEKKTLFNNINYMNITELKSCCRSHKIPFVIAAEYKNGEIKNTRDNDRKGIIIDRLTHYLKTGKIKPQTLFPKSVVRTEALPTQLKPSNRIYYGQYKRDNRILTLMKKLTDNQFKYGAIACEVLRECWSTGKAPTYKEFASLWLQANDDHQSPNAEWAFLKDRHQGNNTTSWKAERVKKANAAIKQLKKLL